MDTHDGPTEAADASRRCPLCGEDNGCGIAQGQETCWCFSTAVPSHVIDQVPDEARNVVCLCARCAAKEKDANSGQP